MNELPNITNNIALNFINSQLFRNGKLIELIDSLSSLENWTEQPLMDDLEYNTQLSIFNTCLECTDSLDDIIELRDKLHLLLTALSRQEKEISMLKKVIEDSLLAHPIRLVFVDTIPLYVPVDSGVSGIKCLIHFSLAKLVESGDINKLSSCANKDCPLLFINQTGRRKWCSMKICGNRHKVERFENKHKKHIKHIN